MIVVSNVVIWSIYVLSAGPKRILSVRLRPDQYQTLRELCGSFGLCYHLVGNSVLCITFIMAVLLFDRRAYKQRCRTASNNMTAAAALTLSDSIVPLSGMANCTSHILSTSLEIPVSSLPRTSAVGRVKSAR